MGADTRMAAGVAAGYVLGRRHKLRTAVMLAGAGWPGRFPVTGGLLSGRAGRPVRR
ncbi:hypothetical protein ACFYSW_29780 [Rhodococcus aetherivorans]|uniref:hypothetical protein n=1 Tax=Rhodococcus aetherivorans TaxID=191292 RepID=UPI0036A76E7E